MPKIHTSYCTISVIKPKSWVRFNCQLAISCGEIKQYGPELVAITKSAEWPMDPSKTSGPELVAKVKRMVDWIYRARTCSFRLLNKQVYVRVRLFLNTMGPEVVTKYEKIANGMPVYLERLSRDWYGSCFESTGVPHKKRTDPKTSPSVSWRGKEDYLRNDFWAASPVFPS